MPNTDLFATAALVSWNRTIERLDQAFAAFSDEELQREVAPGRNRVFYLLAHLTAVHDRMLPLLGLGERAYADLDVYLEKPDRSVADVISAAELRQAWSGTNARLGAAMAALTPGQWLERHTAVSEEDFAKDPQRNRFAVLLSRTNHAWSHGGQVLLAKAGTKE